MSLDLLPKHTETREERPRYRDLYRRTTERRGGYLGARVDLFPSSEYEDVEVQRPVVHRRRHVSRNYQESPRTSAEGSRYEDEGSLDVRKIHHNRHSNYRRASKEQRARELDLLHEKSLNKFYELEVREAQNSSVCNYTVESIPDDRGTRTPKLLEHVKCNHAGSNCLGASTHCCIQTYKKIKVSYGDGDSEVLKLYVGCVCALRQVLLRESKLHIDD